MAKVNLGQVRKIIDAEGLVNVDILAKALHLNEAQACRLIRACWDRGLLLPVREAYFAPGVGDEPVKFRDVRRSVSDQAQRWYKPYLEALRDYFTDPGCLHALTVNDAIELLDCTPNIARKALKMMAMMGELKEEEASTGGAYGHRPLIWYKTDQDWEKRNRQFIEAAKSKTRKPKRAHPRAIEEEEVYVEGVVGLGDRV